jgi:histidine triad (HIT) family protein
MNDCLFCKIVTGEIPAEKIWEDDSSLAFLDVNPLAPGHSMVIPKEHGETLLDVSDESAAELMKAVKQTTGMLERALTPDGFTIGINHKIGQAVDHLHVHILPRFKDDGGGNVHSIVDNRPKEGLAEMAEKIRPAV